MNITFTPEAWAELTEIASRDKRMAKRVYELIKSIQCNPFEGIGKPEALKHELSGYWSRRIDITNRLVYKADYEAVCIIALKGHYK